MTDDLMTVANRMAAMPERITMGDVAKVREAAAEIERLRAAIETAARRVEDQPHVEYFSSDVNGVPIVCKGETQFVRMGEFRRVMRVTASAIRAMAPKDPAP